MLKRVCAILALTVAITGCNFNSKQKHDTAARSICECMNSKEEASDQTHILMEMPELEYSICILEIREEVDPRDQQMSESMAEICPELSALHRDFLAAHYPQK